MRIASLLLLLLPVLGAAEPIQLSNQLWTVQIDPSTLATALSPAKGRTVVLSSAGAAGSVADLEVAPDRACWRLANQGLAVSVSLQGEDLRVQFQADAPTDLVWPRLPSDPLRRAWILPIAEGRYVPEGDRVWRNALTGAYGVLEMTEGLSLPLIGLDQGDCGLGLIVLNPFNTQVRFLAVKGALGMDLAHAFTPLDPQRPYTVLVNLGQGGDSLAAARRYRRVLRDTGAFRSLREKLAAFPEGDRLLGASHLYLWGDGCSRAMIERLRRAGLTRLWLGLPDWQAALYPRERMGSQGDRPEAVTTAREAGFLIGPYDSYDTALPADGDPSWRSAHLGDDIFQRCRILEASGAAKKGFNGQGVYVNQGCVREYQRARIRGLQARAGFNSWFLDCDASGALYDDYNPAHPTSQAQDAQDRNANLAWVADTLRIPVGSEGGSAVVNGSVVFVHGTQTPPFSWTDPAMGKPSRSPWFVGAYWPPGGPAFFFKPTALKAKHRHLHFDPAFRLPLYQTVFHDSVITTHHWTLDSLKFPQVARTNELLQLLYNVPPLLHLNGDTAARRIAFLVRQDAFFRPLHQELANQALTGFQWLSRDRRLQRTVFEGGTQLIANFRSVPAKWNRRTLAAYSVLALLPSGEDREYRVSSE